MRLSICQNVTENDHVGCTLKKNPKGHTNEIWTLNVNVNTRKGPQQSPNKQHFLNSSLWYPPSNKVTPTKSHLS